MSRLLTGTLTVWLLVIGCSPSTGSSFEFDLPGQGTITPLPGVLVDRTGVVQAVGAEALGEAASDLAVSNPPGEPNVLLVSWIGGACDHRVSLEFDHDGFGYTLTGATDRDSGCTLQGISRSIRLELSEAVTADTVTFQSP